MATQKTLDELINENQSNIQKWKEQHKVVKGISVKSKLNGDVPFIIGMPTTSVIDAVSSYHAQEKPHKATEVMVNSCVKAGDISLFAEDVNLKNGVLTKVSDLLERFEIEEKEL